MQEILVVAVIAAALFFIPRLMGKRPVPEDKPRSRRAVTPLTGRMRLAILITALWISAGAAFLKPWTGDTFLFFLTSLGPAMVFWGGIWVWSGYQKYRR